MELRSFGQGFGQNIYSIVLMPYIYSEIIYDKHVKKDRELIIENICMEQGYKIHAMELWRISFTCSWNST